MEGELNYFIMDLIMKDSIRMGNHQEWVDFNGVMESIMKVNGLTVRNMVLVFGRVQKEIHI